MEIEKFIENFGNLFEETDANEIKANTVFKDNDEWGSLMVLMVIAMCDEEYGVTVSGEDIKDTITVEDLYNLVKDRKQ